MYKLSDFDQFQPSVIKVVVPEWDDKAVYVRGMDSVATAEFLAIERKYKQKAEGMAPEEAASLDPIKCAEVIAMQLCDENGAAAIPRENRQQEAIRISRHDYRVVMRLFNAVVDVSGLSQEAIEEKAKN